MPSYENRERRRWRPTKPISCWIPLRTDSTFVLHDLSEVGLALDGPAVAEPGQECVLELGIRPEAPDVPLRLLARCERMAALESGFGVRTAWEIVEHLEREGPRRLDDFLRRQCYDPSG